MTNQEPPNPVAIWIRLANIVIGAGVVFGSGITIYTNIIAQQPISALTYAWLTIGLAMFLVGLLVKRK